MIAVIFSSQRTSYQEGYNEFNVILENLAQENEGFIKQESVRDENGFGISISYWKNEKSAKAFKQVSEHIAAQEKGKSHYYEWYDVKVCKVNKHYTFQKDK